jgi:hypothetical protein
LTWDSYESRLAEGWQVRITKLTPEYSYETWQAEWPQSVLLAVIPANNELFLVGEKLKTAPGPGARLISLATPKLGG